MAAGQRIDTEEIMGLDDEGPVAYYAKGHVDPLCFLVCAVNDHFLEQAPGKVEDVHHGYFRKVPLHDNFVADCRPLPCEKGPGAFPVTWVDVRKWR